MEKSRLNRTLIGLGIVAALLIGLVVGGAINLGNSIFGSGPDPKSIATSSLESMRAQNRLITFVARYVTVVTSRQSRLGMSAERTLIMPGDVRYEVDLAKLQQNDVAWDADTNTLRVRIPDIEVAGPEVDLSAAREYGEGKLMTTIFGGEERLNQANRAAAVEDLRRQARAETPMRLARESARQSIERSFAMPLRAAGIGDARVVARFASEEGSRDPSRWDVSTPYNEAIDEARRRRASEGR